MKTNIAEYDNGNVHVTRFSDGTVIRWSEDDEFNFAYPENMDVKITDCCVGANCAWCHEGSGPNGKHGDILNAKWVDTLRPFTEVALGGGDALNHPDLIPFLKKLKDKNVYANITVNQIHFMRNIDLLRVLTAAEYIHGIGVSLVDPSEKFFQVLQKFPNAVVHVIAGVLTEQQLKILMDHGEALKILILGYKQLRRGEAYYKNDSKNLIQNQISMLEGHIPDMVESFAVTSFDCLALNQLHVRNYLKKDEWDQMYQGDDGTMTFYIDMVNERFAESSTALFDERYNIGNKSVQGMFWKIKEKHNADKN